MAATGIYWCLVLTYNILTNSLASAAYISSFTYTPYPVVCPGDELVFTCIVDDIPEPTIAWRRNGMTVIYELNKQSLPFPDFMINITYYNATERKLISTATSPPEGVHNITINLIADNNLIINWTASGSCIDNYNVTIFRNNTPSESSTTDNPYIAVNTLIIGTNYSFIIIPIDTIGREGPPSSLIQYIWDVPAQVVNITCYNVTDTNTTITGLSPINEYYTLTIIPVNVIGYGTSLTVNVSITNIVMSTTEYTMTQDMSIAKTTITVTQTIISSYIESYASCNTTGTAQSTDVGSISVAIAVPITGLLTGLITAIITSIIVCLIMKKRGTTIQNKTPVGGGGDAAVIGPIYDLPTINTEQQEQIIDTKLNTAYGQTEKNQESL
uniref:Ig-like domain-containing protein n=1 Tax=Amphimedon queenslandica TaxID=400682 RepID=A0A1X7VBM1_AMPQE